MLKFYVKFDVKNVCAFYSKLIFSVANITKKYFFWLQKVNDFERF